MNRCSNKRYDFIVLGAGSSGIGAVYGLALKYPDASILLVEGGPKEDMPVTAKCPLLASYLSWSRKIRPFQRTYHTTAEAGLAKRCVPIAKGKGFGGSSIVDNMLCVRGTRADYAAWGSDKWSWDAMIAAFRRIERNSRGSSALHGEDGQVSVSDPATALANTDLNVRFFQACEAAGIPDCTDFNGEEVDGQGSYQSFIANGSRTDLFNALIMGERHRTPNLEVRANTTVRRLNVDASTATCNGVVLADGDTIEGGTVVSCLGAIESPALLLRSGVGSTETLRVAGVDATVDVPLVGRNLISPLSVDMVFKMTATAGNARCRSFSTDNLSFMWNQWREYNDEHSGVFSSFCEAGAFVRSADAMFAPDLEIAFIPAPILRQGQKRANFKGFTTTITHHRPVSRGVVTIDADGAPQVSVNAFANEEDIQAMDQGVMWAGLLCGPGSPLQSGYHPTPDNKFAAPFQDLVPEMRQPPRPLASQAESVDYLMRSVHLNGSLFGTCAMGTVVDDGLRVMGLKNVCVADCSVVPTPTIGNSRTVGLMVGLRCAEFL